MNEINVFSSLKSEVIDKNFIKRDKNIYFNEFKKLYFKKNLKEKQYIYKLIKTIGTED